MVYNCAIPQLSVVLSRRESKCSGKVCDYSASHVVAHCFVEVALIMLTVCRQVNHNYKTKQYQSIKACHALTKHVKCYDKQKQ